MDTTALDHPHPLSGHNPTLFDVVLQYADTDMLRALAVTSHSLYEALQHCQFTHLTMVVLEAPILKEQQRVVYNGTDPVSPDTFQLTVNDATGPPSSASSLYETQSGGCQPPYLTVWHQRSDINNIYHHNLTIPDYARNFMARAQSVELVVYRRRLGTRISTFFNNNAHYLKHGQPTSLGVCPSGSASAGATAQYKPHLPCSPSDSGCVFTKHRSHEYFKDDGAESRRLRFQAMSSPPRTCHRSFPFVEFPSLELNFRFLPFVEFPLPKLNPGLGAANVRLENGDTVSEKLPRTFPRWDLYCASLVTIGVQRLMNFAGMCIRKVRNYWTELKRRAPEAPHREGHYLIPADLDNTTILGTRFTNLPPVERYMPMKSLKIHTIDCVSFDVDDWCNAMPGCTIQPIQTWVIRDDPKAPRYRHRHQQPDILSSPGTADTTCSNNHDGVNNNGSSLTSLVLQHTPLNGTNQCDIDDIGMPEHIRLSESTAQSHFFIGDDLIRLPHLQHFGVIGTLLNYDQYARFVFYNERINSLSINPRPQPIESNSSYTIHWICGVTKALDQLDDATTRTSSAEAEHKSHPRRRYNFSFDFAKSSLDRRCPHNAGTSSQTVSNCSTTDAYGHTIPKDPSQLGQHQTTCASIHKSLSHLYWNHKDDSENRPELLFSESLLPYLMLDESVYLPAVAFARLARRTLTHLEMRCHYCAYANPGSTSTVFPGACPGDCMATQLPPSTNTPLNISDLPQDDELQIMRDTRRDDQMYMRLRQLLHIPPHVVLRL